MIYQEHWSINVSVYMCGFISLGHQSKQAAFWIIYYFFCGSLIVRTLLLRMVMPRPKNATKNNTMEFSFLDKWLKSALARIYPIRMELIITKTKVV